MKTTFIIRSPLRFALGSLSLGFACGLPLVAHAQAVADDAGAESSPPLEEADASVDAGEPPAEPPLEPPTEPEPLSPSPTSIPQPPEPEPVLEPPSIDAPPIDAPPPPEEVVVAGHRLSRVPGSVQVVGADQLERFEYDDPHAVLQQVPGVYVRGEDGVGLRPNIGLRGVNPNRSMKITLMEDGILFGPAPYSAPAGYFFPLLTRMTQVRVVKGPGAVAYGPQSVGGAVDYVSRAIPASTSGAADVAGGMFGYGKAHAWIGSSDEQIGFLIEGVRLQNTGFAELPSGANTGSTRNEWVAKASYVLDPSARVESSFHLKFVYSDEISNETYLGQSVRDFRTNPYRRYPASALDQMKLRRAGAVVSHVLEGPNAKYRVRTSAYRFEMTRSWNKLNRLGAAYPGAVLESPDDPAFTGYYAVIKGQIDSGSPANTLYIGPNQRSFVSQGLQSVATVEAKTGPIAHRVEGGVRFHHDHIHRDHSETGYWMASGELVPAGEATLVNTRNFARTHAVALHATDAMTYERLTVTPGARIELIESRTEDYLTNENRNGFVTAVMPGVGAYYEVIDHLGVLGGVYRGFSPPSPGQDVSPEYSVNYEGGVRYTHRRARAEIIGFFNDYSNLTDVCTFSSGCVERDVDRQFDAGRARIYGLEAYAAHEARISVIKLPMSAAYTLSYGEFLSDFESQDPIYGTVRRGHSIPYLPRHQLNVTVAVEHKRVGVNGAFNHIARMYERASDRPIDQEIATDAQTWFDLGAYVNALSWLRGYANLRNVLGGEFIVGRRPYGVRPNAPRWFQLGLKASF